MLVTTDDCVKLAVAGVASAQLELKVTVRGVVTRLPLESTIFTEIMLLSPTRILFVAMFNAASVKLLPVPVPIRSGFMVRLDVADG